jgi:hypothetical protein
VEANVSATAASRQLGVTGGTGKTITTDIPARLDRLPSTGCRGAAMGR